MTIVDDQVGCPTYAPDLAEAARDLIERKASGVHHLTNSGQCSWFEFAKAIVEQFSVEADIQPISTATFRQMRPQQAMRPAYSVLGDWDLPRSSAGRCDRGQKRSRRFVRNICEADERAMYACANRSEARASLVHFFNTKGRRKTKARKRAEIQSLNLLVFRGISRRKR